MNIEHSGYMANGIILPLGSYFCCPKCAESRDLQECEDLPLCLVDGTQLLLVVPLGFAEDRLSPQDGCKIKIERIKSNFPEFPGSIYERKLE
jgi:hypothetical protein